MLTHLRLRIPILLSAVLTLMIAIWAGLGRIGWNIPQLNTAHISLHGPLMVSGFFGILLSLERAVALQKRIYYLGSFLAAAGSISVILVPSAPIGGLLFLLSSVFLLGIFSKLLLQHWTSHTFIMGIGALCWVIASILWVLAFPIYLIVHWWIGFLLFTIFGERVELGRLARRSGGRNHLLILFIAFFIVAAALVMQNYALGMQLIGIALLACSLWLASQDIARKTIRIPGLPRFIAICLLSGYVWLTVAGLTAMLFNVQMAGLAYDLYLHSIFIGFVFSMIFGHAPIILPAIIGIIAQYHKIYYFFLFSLHAGLLLRVLGDLFANPELRRIGGLVSGTIMLIYLPTVALYSYNVSRKSRRNGMVLH